MVTKDKSKYNFTGAKFKSKYSNMNDPKQLIKVVRYFHEYILFNNHPLGHVMNLLDQSYSALLRLIEIDKY